MPLPRRPGKGARRLYLTRKVALVITCWGGAPASASAQWSGSAAVGTRGYPDSASGEAPRYELSLIVEAEGSLTWDDRTQILTVAPFIRIDPDNRSRTRIDFLDLVWEKIWNDWEVAIGMRQVSWGVAESVALVDVINQRDFGEDAEAPGRLGQPLLNLRMFTSLGSFEGYVLPDFRERDFAGRGAALWSPLPVDEDGAEFENDRGREHIDWTLRWSHFVGGFDVGLAHFSGTNRDPRFEASPQVGGGPGWIPRYDQIDQTSLDAQWTRDALLLKVELLRRASDFEEFYAVVGGFEYALAGYLSVFVEYLYDGRGGGATVSMENDVFVGTRLLTQDWTVSSRALVDYRSGNVVVSATASRRIGDGATLALDGRLFVGDSSDEPVFARRLDTYLSLSFTLFL